MTASARLRVPTLPEAVVLRQQLVDEGVGRSRLTLVCAPAGSGKTTLVTQWAVARAGAGEPVAWLSVTNEDNRQFSWWTSMLGALAGATPTPLARGLDRLRPPQERLLPGFVEEITDALRRETGRRWLVVDDVHRLTDPDALAGLDLLLSELPDSVGVVLVSRWDPLLPLHRWRLHGTLAEVRASDLAFDETDAATMFEAMGVSLDAESLRRVIVRTEGWAAGLRLAGLSIVDAPNPRAFVDAFEGDRRAVADYLFAEIVQHVPADVLRLLLDTCVAEHLPVDLAVSLSGRRDAGEVLERLFRANALVTRTADGSRLHGLLRTYLTARAKRLDSQAPARQHALIARWFDTHAQPVQAIAHALDAGDPRLVAELVARHGLALLFGGQADIVRDTVRRCPASVVGSPTTALVASLAAFDLADPVSAEEWLLTVPAPPDDERSYALYAAALMSRALLGGVSAAMAAPMKVGVTGDRDIDLIVSLRRAPLRNRIGDVEGSAADLQKALALARAGGYDLVVVTVLGHLAATASVECDLQTCDEAFREIFDLARLRGWTRSPHLVRTYVVACAVAYLRGDLEEVMRYAELAQAAVGQVTSGEVEYMCRLVSLGVAAERATGRERQRAYADAHATWMSRQADDLSPGVTASLVVPRIREPLEIGEHAWAAEAAAAAQRRLPGTAEAALARGLLLMAHGRSTQALKAMVPIVAKDLRAVAPPTVVTAQVLCACIEQSLGQQPRAFETLRQAVSWSAPRALRRPFIDAWSDVGPLLVAHRDRFGPAGAFVEDLIARLQAAPVTPSVVLSARELDILRDLPSRMNLEDIAAAHGVSLNTVKSHVTSIYRKLGVNRRQDAIATARAAGLL